MPIRSHFMNSRLRVTAVQCSVLPTMLADQLNVLNQFKDPLPVASGIYSKSVESSIVHMTEVPSQQKACLPKVVQIFLKVNGSQQVLCI